jgi:cytochrome c2
LIGGNLIVAAILALTPALAIADAAAGKQQFAAQCALCHSAQPTDGGGGQGPSLSGLFGRPAASIDATFPYT